MTDNKTVLVIGGAGYVGSHICKALKQDEFNPVVYDNLSRGFAKAVQWGELIKGDLLDTAALIAAIEKIRPAAVLHFAAFAYVGESVSDPLLYYKNNVTGTLSLLEAMQKTGLDKIIFSSTCAVYGEPPVPLLHEELPKAPISPYGRSKWMIEQALADLSAAGKVRYVALRYFNAAGADGDGEIGENHEPETHLIPLAIQAGRGGNALKIMGTDYPTPDGTAIRDYTHVADLASAHVLALRYLLDGKASAAFNLGSGTGYSVQQIVTALRGLQVPVVAANAPRRAGDPPHLVANIARARDILGWQPRHSDLNNILTTAVKWHDKNHKNSG